jgi:hypothetical protein
VNVTASADDSAVLVPVLAPAEALLERVDSNRENAGGNPAFDWDLSSSDAAVSTAFAALEGVTVTDDVDAMAGAGAWTGAANAAIAGARAPVIVAAALSTFDDAEVASDFG